MRDSLAVGFVFLFGGLYFAWMALRTRRRGNVPHCGRCNYNLTGLVSTRCPECGTEIDERTRVIGRGYRRRWIMVPALLMLGAGGALFVAAARDMDWYRYRPAGWVVEDWQSSVPTVRDKAWQELQRRYADSGLSDRTIDRIIQTCIEDVRAGASPRDYEAFNILTGFLGVDRMTTGQFDRLISVLLDDVVKTKPAGVGGGWDRLNAIGLERLSGEQRQRLIGAMLDLQGSDLRDPNIAEMADYLRICLLRGDLSDAQSERFLEQLLRLELEVRPTIVSGDPVPYRISFVERGTPYSSDGLFFTEVSDQQVCIDDVPLRNHMNIHQGPIGTGSGSSSTLYSYDRPGKHRFIVKAHVAIRHIRRTDYRWDAHDDNIARSTLCHERDIRLETPFEILAEEPANYIRLIEPLKGTANMQKAITIDRIEYDPDSAEWQFRCSTSDLPCSIAFDIYLRIDGNEYLLSSFAAVKGHSGGHTTFSNTDIPRAKKVDVILRPSIKKARATIDLYEIWNGKLVFEDEPVDLKNKSAP